MRFGARSGRVALCFGALLAPAGSAALSAPSAPGPTLELLTTNEWVPSETGPGARSVQVSYRSGCGAGNAHATVRETRASITITVRQETYVYPPGSPPISCPPPPVVTLSVKLSRPLAGRPIYGRSAAVMAEPLRLRRFGPEGPVAVPSLTGFSPQDAMQALLFTYLRSHAIQRRGAGLPRVIAQRPAAGRMVPRGSVVQLVMAGP